MTLLNIVDALAELSGIFRAAFAGWRYLFSSAYRQKIHEGWRFESWLYVAWDVVCALAGIAFSLLPVCLLVAVFVVRG